MNAGYHWSRGMARRKSIVRRPFNVLIVLGSAAAMALASGPLAARAAADGSVNVTSTSPTSPFSQNKQNEPTVAVDANHNNIVAAGADHEVGHEARPPPSRGIPSLFAPG